MVKRILIIVLVLVAGWLAWFLYDSIMEPIRLDRQKDMRYNAAIARLKDIRTAQVASPLPSAVRNLSSLPAI